MFGDGAPDSLNADAVELRVQSIELLPWLRRLTDSSCSNLAPWLQLLVWASPDSAEPRRSDRIRPQPPNDPKSGSLRRLIVIMAMYRQLRGRQAGPVLGGNGPHQRDLSHLLMDQLSCTEDTGVFNLSVGSPTVTAVFSIESVQHFLDCHAVGVRRGV